MTTKIMVFEDNKWQRRQMTKTISEIEPQAEITAFEKTADALEYAQSCYPDIAFISKENADARGYFLLKKVRKQSPGTNVIAVASRYRFLPELYHLRISGYIVEEMTPQKVREEMQNLRYACRANAGNCFQ